MKRKLLKLCSTLLVSSMLIGNMAVFAAIYPGDSYSVNLACGNVEGSVTFTASNATITSGTGNWCDRGKSFTVSVKAGSVGSASISLVGVDATDADSLADYSGKTISSKSFTISTKGSNSSGNTTTSTKPVEDKRSKDNNLSALTVSQGTLSPAFKASTTEYTVELGPTVTSIEITAKAADAKAKVKGTGKVNLEAGENKIKVTVTAENGNPKVYTIIAKVDTSPIDFLPYGDKELGIVRELKKLPKLEGFEETKIKVQDKEYTGWTSLTRNITLLYLQDGDIKNYYIYDEVKGVTSIYVPFTGFGNLAIVDVPADLQERNGAKYQEITIQEMTLNGWKFDNKKFDNYALIYAMDENGNYDFYQYESTQNTLQLFSNASILQEDYDALMKDKEEMTMYFYIACGACVVLLGTAIYAFVSLNRYKNRLFSKNVED